MSSSATTEGPDQGLAVDGPQDDVAPTGMAHRRPRKAFILLGLVLAGALAAGLFSDVGTGPGTTRPRVGAQVPGFSLPRIGGGRLTVPADGGGDGRPAILLFFASWCTPCQKEVPAIAAAYHRQQADTSALAQVVLLGVDGNDPTSNARSFLRTSGVTFPVGADTTYAVTQGKFAFTGLPEAVFVERNGTIAGIHYGALSTSSFVSWERRLLAG